AAKSSGAAGVGVAMLAGAWRISGGSRSSGVMSHSRCQFWRMNGVTTSSTKSRQLCRIRRCSSLSARFEIVSSMSCLRSGGLARAQELAHAVERAQDVLGRVGVGKAHIAFAKNAEVGAADDRDAGVLEQRGSERLRLPAGALDVGEGVERALGRGAGHSRQAVQALDHDLPAPVELVDHLRHLVLRPLERGEAGILRGGVDAGVEGGPELPRMIVELGRPTRIT